MRSQRLWRVGAYVGGMSMAASFAACTAPTSSGSRDDIGGEQYRSLETAAVTPANQSLQERAPHAIKTVFLIMMENHNWSQIKGSPSAPYINGTLLRIGAHAENYGGVVHPSEPNYIWLEAGSDLGILSDAPPAYNDRTTHAHLTTFLDDANVSWKSYQEGIVGDACPLGASGFYDPKHNPMVFFDDVLPTCVAHVRPYAELEKDLSGTPADYNFITPDLCNDMHGASGCPNGDLIASGDAWLATEVPKIMATDAYQKGGAIFITWDEGGGADGPLGMIVVSPLARAGYQNDVAYSHSSTLRTVQEIFAVRPYLRAAEDATSLSDLFTSYP